MRKTSSEKLDFSEIAKELLDTLYGNYKDNLTEDQQKVANTLQKNISKLDKLINYNKAVQNTSKYYSTEAGWNEVLYKKRRNKTDQELFQVCSEILSILRSNAVLDQDLVVYRQQDDGSINIYYGKESKLPNAKEVAGNNNSDWAQQIQYVVNDLEKIKVSADSNFASHYENFKKIATGQHQATTSLSSKYMANKFNNGHVIEAFQRHLFYQHGISEISEEIINSFNPADKNISPQVVVVNLWYSINSDAWYTGGDVGFLQIKGNNSTLASAISVREVASKLLYWVHNRTQFSADDFNKMFTQGTLSDMLNSDLQNIAERNLDELIEEISTKTAGGAKRSKSS